MTTETRPPAPAKSGVPNPAGSRYDGMSGHPAPAITSRFMTLESWIAAVYGGAVSIATARRWCRERRITPAPQKHGRSYFVTQDARYVDRSQIRPRLVEALRAAEAA